MIVETIGLTKRYGPHIALDSVDLAVKAGSAYGLVGPNGSGKTTLLAILAGLRRSSGGELRCTVGMDYGRQPVINCPASAVGWRFVRSDP